MTTSLSDIRVVDDVEVAFATGSESGLRQAYDAHGSLIWSYCQRCVPGAADELTQEVFIAAWRAHERFDPRRGVLPAWLMAIAKNKVIDEYRRRGRRIQSVALDRAPAAAASDEIPEAERLADKMLLAEALDTLNERARAIVELAFFENLTHAEVAERTGYPLGTVKSDIRRGLTRLRSYMEAADV